ncbi:MAG: molybdopterin-dependent oxidoreductase [Anaerovoracaceae bacterium]|jgi:DMSO/TMAO reductase YedYZ molybdopterin-dependent catalytic subunit
MKKKIFAVILCLVVAFSLVACGSSSNDKAQDDGSQKAGNASKATLTITGDQGDHGYSLADLKAMKQETHDYSGRNKTHGNKRFTSRYTGVDLKTLLSDAGYGDAKEIKVSCSDGYSREYDVDSLYGLYYFPDENTAKGEKVPPMIAIVKKGTRMGSNKDFNPDKGTPLRLVYGQEDFDSKDTMDFNMQGWAAYVKKIEVED